MDPIDFRDAQFADLQALLQGKRQAVLEAYRVHGPCTTRELSERSGLDLLLVRPRTTELLQLGCVEVFEDEDEKEDEHDSSRKTEHGKRTHEGIYRARTPGEIHAAFFQSKAEAIDKQLPLKI
jgi:hypothetical protein